MRRAALSLVMITLVSCRSRNANDSLSLEAQTSDLKVCDANLPQDKLLTCKTWQAVAAEPYGPNELPELFNPGPRDALVIADPIASTDSFRGGETMAGRKKVIHRYGTVAPVRFEPVDRPDHPYTGLFREELWGLVRLSLAVKPSPSNIKEAEDLLPAFVTGAMRLEDFLARQTPFVNNYTPGAALKFYAPHQIATGETQDSVNLHIMNSVDGQRSENFFEKSFSNVLPSPASVKARGGAFFFKKGLEAINAADTNPGHLSVEHLSRIDKNGDSVPNPRAPYKLLFVPSKEIRDAYRSHFQSAGGHPDFRSILSHPYFKNVTLWEVWGRDQQQSEADDRTNDIANPAAAGFKLLGRVVPIHQTFAAGTFVASKYGDEQLHFAHFTAIGP